ncbi:hypothetical protein Fcan01_18061 [Folsomia candida]|uniref:Uncharacterized protein n=1 Tax=Folsomia candida TaxID=158441 RepID=A0A226DR45_FOLCA|nr:hypothetical protein Fcan01_18061 [Folsomia candida]
MDEIIEMETEGGPQPAEVVLNGDSFSNISPTRDIINLVPVEPGKTIGDQDLQFILENPNSFTNIGKMNEYKIEFSSEKIEALKLQVATLEDENRISKQTSQHPKESSANNDEIIRNVNDMLIAEREFGSCLRNKLN